jgi:hypothetical protein
VGSSYSHNLSVPKQTHASSNLRQLPLSVAPQSLVLDSPVLAEASCLSYRLFRTFQQTSEVKSPPISYLLIGKSEGLLFPSIFPINVPTKLLYHDWSIWVLGLQTTYVAPKSSYFQHPWHLTTSCIPSVKHVHHSSPHLLSVRSTSYIRRMSAQVGTSPSIMIYP